MVAKRTKPAKPTNFEFFLKEKVDSYEKENKELRVAMDYLLRSPAGLVPIEADKFYNGENATFQKK